MYYLVYQTTNTVNNYIYVGVHITSNLDDGYLGSGKLLARAIAKYGADKFERTILHMCENIDQMFELESQIVNEAFVQRQDTYNIKLGGTGGWDFVNKNGLNFTYEKNRHICGFKNVDPEIRKSWSKKAAQVIKEKYKQYHQGLIEDPHPNRAAFTFKGKTHTDITKQKMSQSHKANGLGRGDGNSQFGTCWINNGTVTKKIDKTELDKYIIEGWTRGRINVHKK